MKITILGATGRTGSEAVEQALDAGHTVYAVARQHGRLQAGPRLKIIVGDATDPNVIAQASKDSDAIISALGAASNKSTLMTDAVQAVIRASKSTGRKRFILMSSFVVKAERLKGIVKVAGGVMRGVAGDKSTSESLVRSSDLDWTIVHASRLTAQPKGSGLRVVPKTEKLSVRHRVARADVAAFMLQEAEQGAYINKEVIVSR